MVRTGAFGYLQYGYEADATYGTLAATINKTFGLEQRITNWSFTNNRITLAELNQIEPAIYAYGVTRGSLGVDFVLSNPWWLNSLWDTVTDTASNPEAGSNRHAYTTVSKLRKSMSIEIGTELGATDVTRRLTGAVVNSIALRSSIGEVVRASADISYKTEAESGVTIDTTPATDGCNFPYTFAYGNITTSGSTLAEIQSFDININQNSDLLYTHNSALAVDAYRRLFEITGSFTASYVDSENLRDVYAQNSIDTAVFAREQTTITLTFWNGLTGANRKQIDLVGTGVGFGDHSVAIEPNEPIFETLTWQVRSMLATAYNGTVSPP